MKIHDVTQQGEEWFRVRKGRVTASNASRIITPKGKDSSQWDAYAVELTAECIRPDEIHKFIGNSNTDGNELEPEAREAFSLRSGLPVTEVGFITNETRYGGVAGCSPDGLIFDGGKAIAGVEIKCPLAKTHAQYLIDGGLPDAYFPQVHYSMAITGLPWYFVSYCQGMKLHVHKCEPDGYTDIMRDAIDRFVIYYGARRDEIMPLLLDAGESLI